MDRRKKQRKKRTIIVITVIIVLFSVFSLLFNRTGSGIENMIRNSVSMVEYYLIKSPIEFVGNVIHEYTSLKDVYEENKILKEQLDNYAREQAMNDILLNQINELKEITEIDFLPTEYNIKYTSIISRDVDSWNSIVTIDLGSMAGISKDMAVISSKGMIGVVTDVTEISATVSLLSSETLVDQIPVKILNDKQNLYGLLQGYDVETGLFEIQLLSTVDTIEENAIVITSGLGGDKKTPQGILIGTAQELTVQNDGATTKLTVKPAADFNDINYVAVVQKKVDGNE